VDSPFVLAAAGTLAIHVILLVAADALIVTHPMHLDPPAPRVRLVDIRIQPRRVAPPPRRDEPRPATPTAAPVHALAPPAHVRAAVPQPIAPPEPEPVATAPVQAPTGGDGPVVAIDDLAPAAQGVPVAHRSGSGGVGGGTGRSTGAGARSGTDPPAPVSVATIKKLAMPRNDYGYVLSKDYPPDAKRLGIEGTLKVRLVVDSSGKVISATLLDHLGYGLDELALAQARGFQFAPARDGEDRPVTSVVVWTFRMTPPK
jgi:protein TonB